MMPQHDLALALPYQGTPQSQSLPSQSPAATPAAHSLSVHPLAAGAVGSNNGGGDASMQAAHLQAMLHRNMLQQQQQQHHMASMQMMHQEQQQQQQQQAQQHMLSQQQQHYMYQQQQAAAQQPQMYPAYPSFVPSYQQQAAGWSPAPGGVPPMMYNPSMMQHPSMHPQMAAYGMPPAGPPQAGMVNMSSPMAYPMAAPQQPFLPMQSQQQGGAPFSLGGMGYPVAAAAASPLSHQPALTPAAVTPPRAPIHAVRIPTPAKHVPLPMPPRPIITAASVAAVARTYPHVRPSAHLHQPSTEEMMGGDARDTLSRLIEAAEDEEANSGDSQGRQPRKRKATDEQHHHTSRPKQTQKVSRKAAKRSIVESEEDDEDSAHRSDEEDENASVDTSDSRYLPRGELACGSIRAEPGAKLLRFRSVIRCGTTDRQGAPQLNLHLPYFSREMDVYTAESDPRLRPLVRASTLADKFSCATNKIGMYLARRRTVMDGIYQATEFTNKPAGKTGLKVGGYFLTQEACQDFERHYWEFREKKQGTRDAVARHRAKAARAQHARNHSNTSSQSNHSGGHVKVEVERNGNGRSSAQPRVRRPKVKTEEGASPAELDQVEAEAEDAIVAKQEEEQQYEEADDEPTVTEAAQPPSIVQLDAAGDATDDDTPVRTPSPRTTGPVIIAPPAPQTRVPSSHGFDSFGQRTALNLMAAHGTLPLRTSFRIPPKDGKLQTVATTGTSLVLTSKDGVMGKQPPSPHADVKVLTPTSSADNSPSGRSRSPPASSVMASLALIRKSLDADAARKQGVLGNGLSSIRAPILPQLPPTSAMFSFLRASPTKTDSSATSPSGSPQFTLPAMVGWDGNALKGSGAPILVDAALGRQ